MAEDVSSEDEQDDVSTQNIKDVRRQCLERTDDIKKIVRQVLKKLEQRLCWYKDIHLLVANQPVAVKVY